MKALYQAPKARDLGVFGAHGQTVLGICYDGFKPYTNCETGTDVQNVVCDPTGNRAGTGACAVGVDVDADPQCNYGSFALVGCKAGSVA